MKKYSIIFVLLFLATTQSLCMKYTNSDSELEQDEITQSIGDDKEIYDSDSDNFPLFDDDGGLMFKMEGLSTNETGEASHLFCSNQPHKKNEKRKKVEKKEKTTEEKVSQLATDDPLAYCTLLGMCGQTNSFSLGSPKGRLAKLKFLDAAGRPTTEVQKFICKRIPSPENKK